MAERSRPIRLIASDLDGTLLRSDRTVSPRMRAALAGARARGILVALATARPPVTTKTFAAAAGLGGIAICSNGALIYDLDADVVVRRSDLQVEPARALISALRAALPGVCFAFVQGTEFACEPAYAAMARAEDHGRLLDRLRLGDAADLLEQPATKIIVRHADRSPDELLDIVTALGVEGLDATHSNAPFVEVFARGVSKAQGLAALCETLQIDAGEVIAFGDAPNDLAMLRWAGRGVAVANAHPAVLAAVAEVTAANDEDGVAQVIEEMLGIASPTAMGREPAILR
jgi:Cof subfamily protein (haloacid dehalogenase superfamily)